MDADVPNPVCQTTCGPWPDEAAACAEFDRRLTESTLFKSYREVWGEYVQPRYGTDMKRPRIDRLLVPSRQFIAAGWPYGVVGVECKASGKKLGPLIAQCLDYSRAVFKVPDIRIDVMCSWIFLWPVDAFAGDVASLMDQGRIGGVYGAAWSLLNFKTASGNLLTIRSPEEFTIRECRQGGKVGSR